MGELIVLSLVYFLFLFKFVSITAVTDLSSPVAVYNCYVCFLCSRTLVFTEDPLTLKVVECDLTALDCGGGVLLD